MYDEKETVIVFTACIVSLHSKTIVRNIVLGADSYRTKTLIILKIKIMV